MKGTGTSTRGKVLEYRRTLHDSRLKQETLISSIGLLLGLKRHSSRRKLMKLENSLEIKMVSRVKVLRI